MRSRYLMSPYLQRWKVRSIMLYNIMVKVFPFAYLIQGIRVIRCYYWNIQDKVISYCCKNGHNLQLNKIMLLCVDRQAEQIHKRLSLGIICCGQTLTGIFIVISCMLNNSPRFFLSIQIQINKYEHREHTWVPRHSFGD